MQCRGRGGEEQVGEDGRRGERVGGRLDGEGGGGGGGELADRH